ncbi:MAG: ABC transporter permease [Anaerolineaceae bacterium]|nr:MAG: ABC transporter permease [Anaerolineaceae bacterium]
MSLVENQRGDTSLTVTTLRPSRGWLGVNLGELWRYRELIYFLIWRDVKVRYKQTLLGAAWAILKPFFSMVIFSVIFGTLAKIPTDEVPPPLFYYAGLLPWVFFQDGISKASTSLVTGRNLITKVYFPRLAIPISSVIAGLVDFLLAFIVLIGMMVYYGYRPTTAVWTLPLFMLLALITSLGGGLWLAALNVAYRDIGYVTPFLVQAWLYASPVVYSATLITGDYWQLIYGLNPMAGVVQGFRWAILGVGQPPSGFLIASVAVALSLLISGALYFRRMERTFADVV